MAIPPLTAENPESGIQNPESRIRTHKHTNTHKPMSTNEQTTIQTQPTIETQTLDTRHSPLDIQSLDTRHLTLDPLGYRVKEERALIQRRTVEPASEPSTFNLQPATPHSYECVISAPPA